MPKVPKNIPPWLTKFAAWAKTKERKHDVQQSIDTFMQVISNRWETFVEQSVKDQSDKPSKPRNIDPIKNLGKAFNKVAERVREVPDNEPEMLEQLKTKVRNVIPPQMKEVLSDDNNNNNNVSDVDHTELVSLVEQVSENLAEVENTINRVTSHSALQSVEDLKQDAAQLTDKLAKAVQTIDQVRDSLAM